MRQLGAESLWKCNTREFRQSIRHFQGKSNNNNSEYLLSGLLCSE